MNMLAFSFLILAPLVIAGKSSQNAILRKALLDGYEKDAKPDGQVEVKVGVQVITAGLCAHRQVFKTTGWMLMMWTDDRLTWDPAAYGGLKNTRINAKNLWIPDITFYNNAAKPTSNFSPIEDASSVVVMSNGMMIFVPPANFETVCKPNFQDWPWGEQNCTMIAGSWTYDQDNVSIQPYVDGEMFKSPLDFEHFTNSAIEILGTDSLREEKTYSCCPDEIYPQLKLSVKFKYAQRYEHGKLVLP